MSTLLKVFAVLLVLGGLWVWASGRSVTQEVAAVPEDSLGASALQAFAGDAGPFDEEGTIVLEENEGTNGSAYILYTQYRDGRAFVKTKRLVFENRDECAAVNLPCATNQPGVPVAPEDRVRVIGTLEDERVIVREVYRL